MSSVLSVFELIYKNSFAVGILKVFLSEYKNFKYSLNYIFRQ